jgi:hypothetical protein
MRPRYRAADVVLPRRRLQLLQASLDLAGALVVALGRLAGALASRLQLLGRGVLFGGSRRSASPRCCPARSMRSVREAARTRW